MNIETGCLGKHAYFTKAEAKRVARGMTRREREAFHLYRCSNCGHLHVGHVVPAFLRQPSTEARSLAYVI
jgi:hypothetical protein